MTEKLKGKKLSFAEDMFKDFTDLVKGSEESLSTIDEDDSLYALKGVKDFPMRVKCATLAWHTFKNALKD
jgi:nitrogen fixation NifU-like protein